MTQKYEANISGMSGIALLFEENANVVDKHSNPWQLTTTAAGSKLTKVDPATMHMMSWYTATDWYVMRGADRAAIQQELDTANGAVHGIYVADMLLDPKRSDEIARLATQEMDQLISDQKVRARLENIMLSVPLSPQGDTDIAIARAEKNGSAIAADFFRTLKTSQDAIREVSKLWTYESCVMPPEESKEAKLRLNRTGTFSNLVREWQKAMERNVPVETARVECSKALVAAMKIK